jgi:membrane protease YdiL (CAAX protease family)
MPDDSDRLTTISPCAESRRAMERSFRRDLFELFVGYGLILVVIWTPNPPQRILYWITFAFIAVSAWLARRHHETHGLGLRGLAPSLWIVGAAIVVFAAALPIARAAGTLHPLYGVIPLGIHLAGYAVWALMQQFILQIYVLLRLLRMGLGRTPAVALSALLFGVAHIPNPVLIVLTLIWGTISCLLFLRYRNLYTIAVAHAVLGMCVAVAVPNSIQHHLRVGLGYVQYGHHHHHRTLLSP